MPKQILLADDSITIQKVIALTFAGEDYKITAVDNGVEAIAKAREIRPDIILADVVMPQKNGYEVSAEIKNDPELKNIPVLLLAGTFEPFDEDEAKRVSADGFIIKPFESQALIQKVKDLISKRSVKVGTTQPQPVSKPPLVSTVAVPVPPVPPVPQVKPVTVPTLSAVPKAPPTPVVTPSAVKPIVPAAPAKPVTMSTPSVAPKVPAPPVAMPVAPAPRAPIPPDEEDFWGTMMEEVEGKVSAIKPSPVTPPETIESGEDVWDMGELEEAPPAAAKSEEELWESFAFEDAESKEEFLETPVEEEVLFGAEEVEEVEIEEAPETIEEGHIELEEEPAEIIKGYEDTFEAESVGVEEPPIPSYKPTPPQVSGALTEEQLRAELGKVSREIIEKIVWEVVPDLAEMLIKEEIKRLQK